MKIAVCVVTYNQEKYIIQCLDSALRQRVHSDVHVDVIVADDASTDRTVLIVEQYQEKYRAHIHLIKQLRNKGTVRNTLDVFRYIFNSGDYKYVAMLDGDDYWCDDYKLQKQIDLCEEENLVMVHSNYCVLTDRLVPQIRKKEDVPQGNVLSEAIRRPLFINCTNLYRTDCLKAMDFEAIESMHQLVAVDHLTNVIVASQGNVGFLEDVTAVWRKHTTAQTSLNNLSKAFRWIEHECVQGRYLNQLFPNVVTFTEKEEYIHRTTMYFRSYVYTHKYKEAKKLWKENDFLLSEPISPFMNNICSFKFYFLYKKINTLKMLIKSRI